MKSNYLKFFKVQSVLVVIFLLLIIFPTLLSAAPESNENKAVLTPYLNASEFLILDIKETLFGKMGLIQNQAAVITSLPASSNVTVNNTFTVDVFLDTTGQSTDGVDIKYLNFDPALLEVQQITPGVLYSATQINTYNNTTGVINFAQVTTGSSIYNGSGTLATITFLAKSAGTATLTFDFVLNDTTDTNVASAGVDVLTSATGAVYTLESVADIQNPTDPTNLSATAVSSSAVDLSWTISTDDIGVANYKVYRCTGSSCTPTVVVGTPTTNSYQDTSLSDTTTYTYVVSAVDAALNESNNSTSDSATTQIPPDTTGPIISNISEANITTSGAAVSFDTDEPATAYIEYGFDASYGQQTTTTVLASSFNISLLGLSAGSTYHYRITATDASSNPRPSLDQTFVTLSALDTTPPSAITDLLASNITETSVDLVTWSAPGDDGNTGTAFSYDIRYSTLNISNAIWSSAIQVTGEPNPLVAGTLQSYTLVGLTPNTLYSTAMKTSDEVPNESGLSNVISFTTLSLSDTTPPARSSGAPTGALSSGTIQTIMSVNTVDENAICKYDTVADTLYASMSDTFGTTGGTSHETIIPNLSSGNSYTYYIRCIDNNNNSNTTDLTISFSVDSSASDITPPTVVSVDPLSDATNVSINSLIRATFSEDIDSSTLNTSTFVLDNGVAGVISYDSGTKESILTPNSTLSYATAYTVTITTGVADAVDNFMSNDYTFSFTTESDPTPTTTTTTASSGGGGGGGGGSYQDTTAPSKPANVITVAADKQITVKWSNPADSDFVRVVIIRKEESAPTRLLDGVVAYEGIEEEFTDVDLDNTKTYYYAIYAHDKKPNYSQAVVVSAQPAAGITTIVIPVIEEAPAPSAITKILTNRVLIGTTSDQVKLLQQMLAQDSEIYPEANTSGYYGPLTVKAVQRFQIKYNIVSSGTPSTTGFGSVGPRTMKKLNEVFGIQTTTPSTISTEQTVIQSPQQSVLGEIKGPFSIGITSSQVKLLQQTLAKDTAIYPEANTSGYYGTLTRRAVQRFQCKYMDICSGSPSENGYGLAGPSTRARINNIFGDIGVVAQIPTTAQASTTEQIPTAQITSNLTQEQTDSIINLLVAFGAEQSVIDNVKASLGSTTQQETTPSQVIIPIDTTTLLKGPFSIGITSSQVKLLQQTLAKDTAIYPEANTSGYYGTLTRRAVQRFQCKYMDICSGSPSENGYGLAGPSTRARINEIF